MVWFLPSECQKEEKKKKVPYLSLFCFKLSVLLHSQTVSLWLVKTVIRVKRFFKKKKKKKHRPHTAPKAAREKEWGRLTGNIRYHELQWPRRQRCKGNWSLLAFRAQRSSAQGRGEQGLGGEGALAALRQFIQEGSSAPFWRIPPLYLATSLPVSCRVFFSR